MLQVLEVDIIIIVISRYSVIGDGLVVLLLLEVST
jgi:hypothetical protein